MQEKVEDDPGRCFAVRAGPGEVVIIPPGWGHATISGDPDQPLTIGAWCVRSYAFDYDGVRAHGGLAWFPLLDADGHIRWEHNDTYEYGELIQKSPEGYGFLGLEKGLSIYEQFETDPDRFLFVPEPQKIEERWGKFVP